MHIFDRSAQVIDFATPPTVRRVFHTANSAECLSLQVASAVALMGCACGKASQASQPEQDAQELCKER